MLRCADAVTSNHSHPPRSVEASSRRIARMRRLANVTSSRPRPAISSRELIYRLDTRVRGD
eukprot:5665349-Prymnesium_polylepis.1